MSVVNDIEIIVSEIDGVITNGCDSIDYMNHTMFKTFCMRDFEAITELQAHFTFVFLSSDVAISF
jgi:3-deoxy-D-manno-octulosonate 8-phosphate phosphatase KdsC-like HAD superfamily phosphatase